MEWIVNNRTDPAFSLAAEEYFFRKIKPGHPGYAILWQNSPAIVVGRFQNTRQEINASFVGERDIQVVRRMTGGGAVYHDRGTLNYTFIHYLERAGELPSFREAGQPIAEALQDLGLPVTFSGRNDLMLGERKVAGVAYCQEKQRFLHHGCILIDSDLDVLSLALRVDPEKFLSKGVSSVRSRVGNLNDVLPLTVEQIRTAIMSRRNGPSRSLSEEDVAAITALRDSKYATWEWTYGASPPYTERKAHRFSWGKLEALLEVRHGKIVACHLYGDFFLAGSGTAEEVTLSKLEQALHQIPYTDAAVQSALDRFPLHLLFSGCDPEAIKAFLSPSFS